MQKLFTKILFPVDFAPYTVKVAEKAAELAKEYSCSLHFLHVVRVSPFNVFETGESQNSDTASGAENDAGPLFELKFLSERISKHTRGAIVPTISIMKGSWDESIINYTKQTGIDLVLVAQKRKTARKRSLLINPDKITTRTNVPVLTVPANRVITQLSSIVIPVTDFIPVRKLMYGIYLAIHYNSTLKLLGIELDNARETTDNYLKKSYQLIHENCSVKTQFETIRCKNVAEGLNEYSMMQSADLILVNPDTQTRMPGLLSRFFGNILQQHAFPPVLTINPL